MTTDLILGVAGHIDHGKTALVRALTGVDTDRLPEEKKRGMTIDLGFAELRVDNWRFGVVDAPGHERFIRNMLAGAATIDVALLVVAADDSIHRQTREHFEILRLLGIPAGVVAITKCDLAEADWIDEVEAEIREFTAGTFLADAPIIRTSIVSGMGLTELPAALASAAASLPADQKVDAASLPFRLPIDRAFSLAGHGAIVTGSVATGRCNVGDALVLHPAGDAVRVRGLQQHDAATETVSTGQRAAINLAGVHHSDLKRGQELAAVDYLKPTRKLFAKIELLKSAKAPLRDRERVRLHLGAAEIIAAVRLWGETELASGETTHAMLALSEPAVASWGQRFILRRMSPVDTIGGGRVLVPAADSVRKPDAEEQALLQSLDSNDRLTRGPAALYFEPLSELASPRMQCIAGMAPNEAEINDWLKAGDVVRLDLSASRGLFIHRLEIERWAQRVEKLLDRWHTAKPLMDAFPREPLLQKLAGPDERPVIIAAIAHLQAEKAIRSRGDRLSLAGRGPQLSNNQRTLLDRIISEYREAKLATPSIEEFCRNLDRQKKAAPKLFELAVGRGDLVAMGSGIYLHSDTVSELKDQLRAAFAEKSELAVSDIRVILDSTRKYVIPICEHLDATGFTIRQGNLRRLAPES